MKHVKRPKPGPFSRVRRDERGGVMTIVGILLVTGVLFGSLALSVDVGRILVEKRQLQNSADAAALSLAKSCQKTLNPTAPNTCVLGADNYARLVDNNASDRVSGIQSACTMNFTRSTLPACPASTSALADCKPLPPNLAGYAGLPYVEVRTKTQSGAHTDGMANWLAGLIGNPTSSAGACSRAAVGSATGSGELPITISACEWSRATGGVIGSGGGAYYTPPTYNGTTTPDYGYGGTSPAWPAGAVAAPNYTLGQENVLMTQNPPSGQTPPSPCPLFSSGHQLPGGFSLLETESGNRCKIKEYEFSWMHSDTGASLQCDLSQYVGKVIQLPIFECTALALPSPGRDAILTGPGADPCDTGQGNNAYYWRAGYASFYLSGYRMTTASSIPNRVRSINPNNALDNNDNPCKNNESCIIGWFTTGSLSGTGGISGAPGSNTYFGTTRVVPAG